MPAAANEQEVVEINGGITYVYKQTVTKRMKTSEFLDTLQKSGGTTTGILPYGCVYYKEGKFEKASGNQGASYRLHVIATRPKLTTIRFQGRDQDEEKSDEQKKVRSFTLAMPWVFTFVSYLNNGLARVVLLAGMDEAGLSKSAEQTPMYIIPLPNMQGGTFCLGELRLDSSQSFTEKTNKVVQFIEESVWNNDLWPRFGTDDNSSPSVKSIRHWADLTAKNGQGFWRSLKPIKAGTFGQTIKGLTQ
jgi:hypothetical protein